MENKGLTKRAEKRLKEHPGYPVRDKSFCQAVEKTGEEEDTGIPGGGLGTGEQKGKCCSEAGVHWTHRGKEEIPDEETRPKETFPQC